MKTTPPSKGPDSRQDLIWCARCQNGVTDNENAPETVRGRFEDSAIFGQLEGRTTKWAREDLNLHPLLGDTT